MPAITPSDRPLLMLRFDGRAAFNRQASRVLPLDLVQVRLLAPGKPGNRWLLLPGLPGGHAVSSRPDRLGYLRLVLRDMATQAFALTPRGTRQLYFELKPAGQFFALHPVGFDDNPPADQAA